MIYRTLWANLLIQGMTFCTSILTARILGPTGRGELALVLLYPQLVAAIGLLGVDRAVAVQAGEGKISRPIGTIAILCLAMTVPAILAGYYAIHAQIDDQQILRLSTLYLVCVPGIYFYTCTVFLFNGVGDFNKFNRVRLGFYVSNCVWLILIALADPLSALNWVVAANATSVLVAALLAGGLLWSLSASKSGDAAGKSNYSSLLSIGSMALRFAIPVGLTNLNNSAYQVVLQQRSDVTTLGTFIVLYSYSRLLSPVGNAIGSHIFRRGIAGADQDISQVFRCSLIVYSAAAFPLILAATWVIPVIFGNAFKVHLGTVALLFAACILALSADGMAEYLKGRRRIRSETVAVIAQIIVIVFVGWMLVPLLSMLGIAIALGCSEFVRCAFLVQGVVQDSHGRLVDFIKLRKADFEILFLQAIHLVWKKAS